MDKELAEEVARRYSLLSTINPNNKLLKYFFVDEGGHFCMPKTYFEEFADRFKESSRTTIRDFAINAVRESSTPDGRIDMESVIEKGTKYGAELFQMTMRNYLSELEKEIWKIEVRN